MQVAPPRPAGSRRPDWPKEVDPARYEAAVVTALRKYAGRYEARSLKWAHCGFYQDKEGTLKCVLFDTRPIDNPAHGDELEERVKVMLERYELTE